MSDFNDEIDTSEVESIEVTTVDQLLSAMDAVIRSDPNIEQFLLSSHQSMVYQERYPGQTEYRGIEIVFS